MKKICAAIMLLLVLGCSVSEAMAQRQFLPYFGGEEWRCNQGNFDDPLAPNYTHNEDEANGSMKYAWDFGPFAMSCMGLPVVSPVTGTVVYVYDNSSNTSNSGWGFTVIVQNEEGCYKLHHFSKVFVYEGQEVRASQALGLCGNTGFSISQGGDGSHIHFQKDTACYQNSQSVASFFEDIGPYDGQYNQDPATDRLHGIAKESRPYRSGNFGVLDKKYFESGHYQVVGHLDNPADSPNWLGIYPYFSWTTGKTENVYIQRFAGGMLGNTAIIYNPLEGFTDAYLLSGRFLERWEAHGGPRAPEGSPTSDIFWLRSFSGQLPLTARVNYRFAYGTYDSVHGLRWFDYQGNLLNENMARPSGIVPGGIDASLDRDHRTWDPKLSPHFINSFNENLFYMQLYKPIAYLRQHGTSPAWIQTWGIDSNTPWTENGMAVYDKLALREVWMMFHTGDLLSFDEDNINVYQLPADDPRVDAYYRLHIPEILGNSDFKPEREVNKRKVYNLRFFLDYFRQDPQLPPGHDRYYSLGYPISPEIFTEYYGEKFVIQFFSNYFLVWNLSCGGKEYIEQHEYSELRNGWYGILQLCHFQPSQARAVYIACSDCIKMQLLEVEPTEEGEVPDDGGQDPQQNEQVHISYLPDLSLVDAVSAVASYQAGGNPFRVSWKVQNVSEGGMHEDNINLALVLSTDVNFSQEDYAIEKRELFHFEPFQAKEGHFSVDLPENFSAGNYFLLVKVDSESRVEETSEDNNLKVIPLTVTTVYSTRDLDHDGYTDGRFGGTDCDDSEYPIHPNAPDWCLDGIDQDCDGVDNSFCPQKTFYCESPQVCNLQEALDSLQYGDTLLLGCGRWEITSQILFPRDGITVKGACGAEGTVIDGSNLPDSCVVFINHETNHTILEGLTIENCLDNAIEVWDGSYPRLISLIIRNNGQNGVTIKNSITGMTFVENCLIYGNRDNGVQVMQATFSIEASTIVGNGREGVYIAGGANFYSYIIASIIAENGRDAVWMQNANFPLLMNASALWGNGIGNDFTPPQNPGNYLLYRDNPRFVNSSTGDYRLNSNSPYIDRVGSPFSYAAPTTDVFGKNSRRVGGNYDLGADEYDPQDFIITDEEFCEAYLTSQPGVLAFHQWSQGSLQEVSDRCLKSGNTLLVGDGIFYINNFTLKKGVHYLGKNGPMRTILDGGAQGQENEANGERDGVESSSCVAIGAGHDRATVLEGFTIRNCANLGIFVRESAATLKRLIVHDTASVGIYRSQPAPEATIISNVLVHRAGESGIVINAAEAKLDHVTSVENTFNGIACVLGGAKCEIVNSILAYNGKRGISHDEQGIITEVNVRAVNLYGNIEDNPETVFEPNALIYRESPLFLDRSTGNYGLSHLSPLLEKGAEGFMSPSALDLKGFPRVNGQKADLGALEFDANGF